MLHSMTAFGRGEAGADGYLVKSSPTETLLAAIEDVHEGGAPMSSHIARKVVRQFRLFAPSKDDTENLAPREREVLDLLAEGLGVAQISRRLYISDSTTKTHISKLYEKLGLPKDKSVE